MEQRGGSELGCWKDPLQEEGFLGQRVSRSKLSGIVGWGRLPRTFQTSEM